MSRLRRGYKLARRVAAAFRAPRRPLDAELSRAWFRAYGFRTIIDVGANEGQFAAAARAAFPVAQLYCFEPLPECRATLGRAFATDAHFEAFEVALGERSGTAEIQRNAYSPSSSLLPMEATHVAAFAQTAQSAPLQIQLRTLDEVLAERELPGPVLLKLDVQGYESQVLAGGPRVLARCAAVLVEMSLEPLYRGEPLFDEVYRQVHAAGFALRGVLDMLRRPQDGHPLQLDALFVRR